MPLRTPEEKGTRRTWSRRFGVDDFPQAGGLFLDGRAGDIGADDFRALENARYNGKRIVSRGGQIKDTTTPVAGCVLGLIEVDSSQAFLIGSSDDEARLDRVVFGSYTSPAIGPEGPFPQFCSALNPLLPRDCLINFAGKMLALVCDLVGGTSSVYEISFPPPDTPAADFVTRTKMLKQFDLPGDDPISSWVWKFELDKDNNSVPVLYMGALTSGKVYRWDSVNLVTDTLAALPGTQRMILGVHQNDLIAVRTGAITKRNYSSGDSGLWNIAITSTDPLPLIPTSAHETGGAFVIGEDGGSLLTVWPGSGDAHAQAVPAPPAEPGFAPLGVSDLALLPTGELGLAIYGQDGLPREGFIGSYTPFQGAVITNPYTYRWTAEAVDAHAGALLVLGTTVLVTANSAIVSADQPELLQLPGEISLHSYAVSNFPPGDMVAV